MTGGLFIFDDHGVAAPAPEPLSFRVGDEVRHMLGFVGVIDELIDDDVPAAAVVTWETGAVSRCALTLLRGRSAVDRQPHKLEAAGSNPAPAPNLDDQGR